MPIVPETMLLVSEALPGVLAGGTQTIPLLRDFLMVVFAYIFGWRESTVATLSLHHVSLVETVIHFTEDFCKGF